MDRATYCVANCTYIRTERTGDQPFALSWDSDTCVDICPSGNFSWYAQRSSRYCVGECKTDQYYEKFTQYGVNLTHCMGDCWMSYLGHVYHSADKTERECQKKCPNNAATTGKVCRAPCKKYVYLYNSSYAPENVYPDPLEKRVSVTTELCLNYCEDWAPVLVDNRKCVYNCLETESFVDNGRCSATCESQVFYYSGWNGTKICSNYVCPLYEERDDDQNPPEKVRLCR